MQMDTNQVMNVYAYRHAWYSEEHARETGQVMVYTDLENNEIRITYSEDSEGIRKPLGERYGYVDAKHVGIVKYLLRCELVN